MNFVPAAATTAPSYRPLWRRICAVILWPLITLPLTLIRLVRTFLFGPPKGKRVRAGGAFRTVRIYRRSERLGPVYTLTFKNREKAEGIFGGLRALFLTVPVLIAGLLGCGLLIMNVIGLFANPGANVPFILNALSGSGPRQDVFMVLWALSGPFLLMRARRIGLPRRRLRIELDFGRGMLRVMRFGRTRLRRALEFTDLTIEEHPEALAERIDRQIHNQKGPGWKDKQHCLVAWCGHRGHEPVILATRVEWPNRHSLMEVREAILWAMAHQSEAPAPSAIPKAGPQPIAPPLD